MWMEMHVPTAAGAAPVADPAQQNPTCSIPLLCTLLSIMASECESGDAVPHQHEHEHLQPHGTEQLSRIAVDYSPHACRHVPDSGEIHVSYDHSGGARWRSLRRFLPGGAVAAAIRAPAGDTTGLNYNLYLSSLEGSRDMDEIDFEFLGRDKRAVQTNFHVGGGGGRERIHELPFDSSDRFHHYAIAWSAEAIEWRVDGELVRREERRAGEPWPEKPMFLYASVWDASDIDEGRWTGTYHGRDAPYVCSYRDVRVPVALSVEEEEEEEEEECQGHANAGDAPDAAAASTICSSAAAAVEEEECPDHANAGDAPGTGATICSSAAAVEEVDAGAGKN